MSDFSFSSKGPSSRGHSSSAQFAPPDRIQLSPPSLEGIPPQSLGNASNMTQHHQYTAQGPTLPPLQHRDGLGAFPSTPQRGFTPQKPQPIRHNSGGNLPPPPTGPHPAPDYNQVHESSPSYDPAQQPEAKNHKSPPKRPAAAESPDGNAPSSSGRKRARTKVVAWDPKDLEDIYERKEIRNEDWDSICKIYPSRTKVAMRQQVIKLREKKQREAAGLSHQTGTPSMYTGSPQAASSSNAIRWATVNGGSPASADPYQRQESDEDEESCEEGFLDSAADSDANGKLNRSFDRPAGNTPQQARAHPSTEVCPDQSDSPSMPVIIQEAPQASIQAHPNFDVGAAQSRGKPIAPRVPSSMPTENPDDRHQHPHPPPPPEPRATQRAKRGLDAMATSESRSSSLNKRRKHQPDPDRSTMAVDNNVEGYAVPFNPAVTFPMHPAPLILPQDSDLDELCISFRDTFRTLKAWYQERERTNEAAIGRANARVAQVQQSADDVSESYSERMKELVKVKDELRAIRLEIQFRDQRYRNLEDDHQRLLDQHARAQEESMQLRGEITKKDERIAVLSNALEHERRTKASETDTSTSIDAVRQELHGAQQDAQRAKQEVLGAKQDAQRAKQDAQRARQDAERADVANNLLTAEITRLRPNPAQARRRFQEVEAAHDNLGARVEDFLAQDLEGLTHKEMTKLVLGMKEAHQQQVNKAKAYRDFLHTLEHLACGEADQSSNLTLTNGQLPQHQP